jgi:hypothetical protein
LQTPLSLYKIFFQRLSVTPLPLYITGMLLFLHDNFRQSPCSTPRHKAAVDRASTATEQTNWRISMAARIYVRAALARNFTRCVDTIKAIAVGFTTDYDSRH